MRCVLLVLYTSMGHNIRVRSPRGLHLSNSSGNSIIPSSSPLSGRPKGPETPTMYPVPTTSSRWPWLHNPTTPTSKSPQFLVSRPTRRLRHPFFHLLRTSSRATSTKAPWLRRGERSPTPAKQVTLRFRARRCPTIPQRHRQYRQRRRQLRQDLCVPVDPTWPPCSRWGGKAAPTRQLPVFGQNPPYTTPATTPRTSQLARSPHPATSRRHLQHPPHRVKDGDSTPSGEPPRRRCLGPLGRPDYFHPCSGWTNPNQSMFQVHPSIPLNPRTLHPHTTMMAALADGSVPAFSPASPPLPGNSARLPAARSSREIIEANDSAEPATRCSSKGRHPCSSIGLVQ